MLETLSFCSALILFTLFHVCLHSDFYRQDCLVIVLSCKIMENIVNLIDKLKVDEELLRNCKIQLLSLEDIACIRKNNNWELELRINIEYDLNYDKLYHGKWSEVPEERRQMFQVLSFLKAYCIVKNYTKHDHDRLKKALYILDVAIITGAGLKESNLLTEFAQLLHEFLGNIKICNHLFYLFKFFFKQF